MLPWKRHIPKTLRSLIAVGTLSALVALALGKTHDIALGQDPVPTKEQTKDPKRDPVKGSAEQAPVKKSDEQVPVKEAGGKDPLKKTDEKLPVKESDKKDPVKKTEELNENSKEITHEGQLIAMIGNRLTMTGKDGKARAFQLKRDAKLTLEGKACRATDLKPPMKLRVTTLAVEQGEAIRVEGLGMEPPRKSN